MRKTVKTARVWEWGKFGLLRYFVPADRVLAHARQAIEARTPAYRVAVEVDGRSWWWEAPPT